MHQTGGPGWRITMDTSGPMLIALYVRDAAGLDAVGSPHSATWHRRSVPPTTPTSSTRSAAAGALKTEWEAWWEQLLKAHPEMAPELAPPGFRAFGNSPALRRVLQAHFGAALPGPGNAGASMPRSRRNGTPAATTQLLADMVDDRLLEVGRDASDFDLTIIELPLAEPRAWYLEPDKIIMSHELIVRPELFRSYVQPVVELLRLRTVPLRYCGRGGSPRVSASPVTAAGPATVMRTWPARCRLQPSRRRFQPALDPTSVIGQGLGVGHRPLRAPPRPAVPSASTCRAGPQWRPERRRRPLQALARPRPGPRRPSGERSVQSSPAGSGPVRAEANARAIASCWA